MEADCFLTRPDESQVFVDPTGRRAVAVARLVRLAALAFAAWMAALVAGASGFGGLPTPVRAVPRVVHVWPAVRASVGPAAHRPRRS